MLQLQLKTPIFTPSHGTGSLTH